jgi:poly(A) polymerase
LLKSKESSLNELTAPVGAAPGVPRILPRDQHTVSRAHISANALRVLYRLKESGYQAFLVGGCVRDLLLGITPKDFDVVTDALPDDVRKLFRNCRLIGRRFRLAHVFFGREIIEVATFRGQEAIAPGEETEIEAEEDAERSVDAAGRILRDNIYGTIDQDVWRRDFTVNALYYNIADFSVWDYSSGVEDIALRCLRLIGDPQVRYREDPVRMLRAARFEAKLAFELAPQTAQPIAELGYLLGSVPPARLFDELLKLFLTGHGARSLQVLQNRQLLAQLLPQVATYLQQHTDGAVTRLLLQGLNNTDTRVQESKSVTPTFLLALLLYGPIARHIEAAPAEQWHDVRTITDACNKVLRDVQTRISVPRRFALGVQEMFALQPRLEAPRGRRILRLLEHPRFRAAYDLLLLRAEQGLASPEIAQWWTRLQAAEPEQRAEWIHSLTESEQKNSSSRRPRRRRRRVTRSL